MPTAAGARRPAAARIDRTDKRDALLRAAIDTFAARGFFNAQVADVARAAGVAAGTVYLYFRGKDDLLISIFERTMKEAIADGRKSVDRLTDPVERLREIARLHLGRLGRDRALAVVFQVELRQSTKFMERFSSTQLREYLGIIRSVIADGQAREVFRATVSPRSPPSSSSAPSTRWRPTGSSAGGSTRSPPRPMRSSTSSSAAWRNHR
jgi:TetR/AcrR family fatty acid metabolism transcriptional regulator